MIIVQGSVIDIWETAKNCAEVTVVKMFEANPKLFPNGLTVKNKFTKEAQAQFDEIYGIFKSVLEEGTNT